MALGDFFLNGTKLDPSGMKFSEHKVVIGGDERLLNGGLRRDVTARKYTADFNWEFLPEYTYTGSYHAYSDLRALGTVAGTMTFIRPVGTSTGTEQYKVFCSCPPGELAFRSAGTVFYNTSIAVSEG